MPLESTESVFPVDPISGGSVELTERLCECAAMPGKGPPKTAGEIVSSLPFGLKPLLRYVPVPALTSESGLSGLLVEGEAKLVFLECWTPCMTDVWRW